MTPHPDPDQTPPGSEPEIPSSSVACAYCDSTETEFFSLFGQSLLSSQYYCHNCRTVFESVRWTEGAENDRTADGI